MQTTPPPLLPSSHDTVNVQPPQVPCPMVPEDALVDAPVREDLTSSNGTSMDVAKSSGLPPTPNAMKAMNLHASPPPEAPVTSSEPCAITSQQLNAPFGQSDSIPATMPAIGDDPIVANANNLSDLVLSIPKLSEVVARDSSFECIVNGGQSSVPASQSNNASPSISRSQGSPELCLVSEDSTNEAEAPLIRDMAFAAPSLDQGNGISVIPQHGFVRSEVKANIASREIEGNMGQLEITPNMDTVEYAGANEDEALKIDSIKLEEPPVRILVSITRY
jgi:hypothetical protein